MTVPSDPTDPSEPIDATGSGLPDATRPGTSEATGSGLPDADSYYLPLGDGCYQPTRWAQGVWSEKEQHMGPVSGLLTHELERHAPREDLQLSRIAFEIYGMIAAEPSRVEVRTLRPGRTIELLEATMSVGERLVVRATAWRMSRQDTREVAGGTAAPLPDPETLPEWDGSRRWIGGFIDSLESRQAPDAEPGRGRSWLRTRHPLVEGVESSALARFVGLVDTANGVTTRVQPGTWMFPNLDLTVHLFRQPEPGWVGFDTEVVFGEDGVGVTSATLHDRRGPVGRSEQILTVRRLPS